ncbi:hypothetical protein [Snodgrassella gandavensis]|uniref:hypothetical protein n=1 Tax=Snodgrassella gandavensis TaxID=2946698 RepID=UPI001EF5268B|nr:hypothetical protein [Snodgrassella gandavensis]
MKFIPISLFALTLLSACSVGMPSNVAVGIGGGNHNFGLGTSIYFPIITKPQPSEPPTIAGTEQPSQPAPKSSTQQKKPRPN